MLTRKDGITNIQLPSSMRKVPPLEETDENWIAVIIKDVFPGETNVQLGRYLDPNLDDACASWKKEQKKELSDMYKRMLIGYGVKRTDIEAYARRSRYCKDLKHAHLIGLADPTNQIPEGMVFITGFTTDISTGERTLIGKGHKQMYVSRSPAVSPGDAKILSVLSEKPTEMSDKNWNCLCSYRFGSIIFGAPRKKLLASPLPCIIANGDLDGDYYFVCWDEVIMKHLLHAKDELTTKSRKLLLELKLQNRTHTVDKTTNYTSSQGGENWLSLAQDKMLDFTLQNAESQIIGKLYTLCVSASKKVGGKVDIYDKDACSFAQAYQDALDIKKHGGKIYLPSHLNDSIPSSLKHLLK